MPDNAAAPQSLPHRHWLLIIFSVVMAFVVGAAAVAVIAYVMNKAADERYIKAIQESTQAQKELGKALAASGHVVDYDEVAKRAKAAMGDEVMRELRDTKARLTTVTTTLASVQYEVRNLRKEDGLIKPGPDGSFMHTFTQNRTPPLTSLQLDYQPKRLGTPIIGKWMNNKELFTIGSATWRTENDGLRVATTMKREVFDGAGVSLGSEDVKMDKSDTFIPKDELRRFAPFPKWTFNLLTSFDTTNGKKGFTVDTTRWYRRDLGVVLGYTKVGAAKQVNFGVSLNVGTQ